MNIRKIATVAVAASLMLGTTGCTFVSPIASRIEYAPSDGSQVTLKHVDARNFIFLSDGAGHFGLFGSLVNRDLTSTSVKLQFTDATTGEKMEAFFTLLPSQKLDFGYNGASALNFDLGGKPGQVATVFVVAEGEAGQAMNVPVLDGTLPEYAELYKSIGATMPAATEAPAEAPAEDHGDEGSH
ncbi:MAG: hypothetical protein RIS66_346 [Actinomycetota bacterium]|jgi:hypothetical protein